MEQFPPARDMKSELAKATAATAMLALPLVTLHIVHKRTSRG